MKYILTIAFILLSIRVDSASLSGPILHGECFTLSQLQQLGVMQWTSTGDMQAASFHSPISGCEATIERSAHLIDTLDVDEGTSATFNPFDISIRACGRYQVDLRTIDNETIEFVVDMECDESIYINTDEVPISTIPEPATLGMVLFGLIALILRMR